MLADRLRANSKVGERAVNPSLIIEKDASGSYSYIDSATGERIEPRAGGSRFSAVLSGLTESKCANYGSDD